ncbi:MAG: SMC-Scp complex subunit ScpB [Patescibacteria group bacterium]
MTDTNTLAAQAHALLFAEGGALTFKQLTRSLGCDHAALMQSLEALEKRLEGTGLTLVRSDTEAALVIANTARDVVAKTVAEAAERDIGNAGLEVLAILLYEGPSTRAQIDYVRGVNSSSTIRTLLTRGCIERSGNPEDGREYLYKPTTDLLAHLGTRTREDLPEYGTIGRELAAFKAAQKEHGTGDGPESDTN